MSRDGLKALIATLAIGFLFWVTLIVCIKTLTWEVGNTPAVVSTPQIKAVESEEYTEFIVYEGDSGDIELTIPWSFDHLPKVGSVWIVMGTDSVRYLEEVKP